MRSRAEAFATQACFDTSGIAVLLSSQGPPKQNFNKIVIFHLMQTFWKNHGLKKVGQPQDHATVKDLLLANYSPELSDKKGTTNHCIRRKCFCYNLQQFLRSALGRDT